MADWLDTLDPWLLYPAALLVVLAGAALGRRLGDRSRRGDADNADHLPAVQGALLGLLSLMIGFTLSLSLGRLQARQTAVLHETVAIETAFSRATLLPSDQAPAARRLLGDYLASRLALGAPGDRPGRRLAVSRQSARLAHALWEEGRIAMAADSRSIPASLFVAAIDGLDEANEERLAADFTRVPAPVFATLFALALAAFGYLGFVSGVKGARNGLSNALLAAAFVTVITIVADLDRPQDGLVTISQRSLLALAAGER